MLRRLSTMESWDPSGVRIVTADLLTRALVVHPYVSADA